MKPSILTHTIAALLLAAPITMADEKKPAEKMEAGGGASASTSVVTSADGTATVTIDGNGKKETRTFKLGDGNEAFTFKVGEDGKAGEGVGEIGFGGGARLVEANRKTEKGPWIGIAMEPVSETLRAQLSLAKGEGIVVNHVAPESPAAKAGLAANDILLRFDDQILVEGSQLRKLIAMKKAGDTVKLVYMRKGERKEATATLVEHEIESGEHEGFNLFQMSPGHPLRLEEGNHEVQERLQEMLKGLKEKHPGVIVEKRSWLSAPGAPLPPGAPPKGAGGFGAWGPGNPDPFRGNLDHMRKQLENMKLPPEEMEKIRKTLDQAAEATEKARAEFDRTMKEFGHPFKKGGGEGGEPKGGEGKKGDGKKGEEPPKPSGKKPAESL